MEFIDIPTEQTTSVTDIVLALLALGLTVALFVAGVVYDMRGFSLPRVLLPIVLINGLFHIIQMLGLVFFLLGLRSGFLTRTIGYKVSS
jgi:hypothetical protein